MDMYDVSNEESHFSDVFICSVEAYSVEYNCT